MNMAEMTASAAMFSDVFANERPLRREVVDRLHEDAVVALLQERFRFFLGSGRTTDAAEALLLAVGYGRTEALLLAHDPQVFH